MQLESILRPELSLCNLEGISKKRVLESSAEKIAGQIDGLTANQIYDALIAREQLGSTGLGNGIAIPHCRVSKCKDTVGCLVKLKSPIDFDAIDNKPVDLLFFLLVPENTIEGHLEVLRMLAERFIKPEYCSRLRSAETDQDLFDAAMTLD
jgi:nitrogen PTS system EIIA component